MKGNGVIEDNSIKQYNKRRFFQKSNLLKRQNDGIKDLHIIYENQYYLIKKVENIYIGEQFTEIVPKDINNFDISSMKHDNILQIIQEENIFIAEPMEYTLQNFLQKNDSKIDEYYIIKQIANFIQFLHSQNLAHTELSTRNLLINEKQQIKAIPLPQERVQYRAPERIISYELENMKSEDMFQLGCIILEILSKKPLLESDDEASQMIKYSLFLGRPTEDIYSQILDNLPDTQHANINSYLIKNDSRLAQLLPILLLYDPEKRATIEQIQIYLQQISSNIDSDNTTSNKNISHFNQNSNKSLHSLKQKPIRKQIYGTKDGLPGYYIQDDEPAINLYENNDQNDFSTPKSSKYLSKNNLDNSTNTILEQTDQNNQNILKLKESEMNPFNSKQSLDNNSDIKLNNKSYQNHNSSIASLTQNKQKQHSIHNIETLLRSKPSKIQFSIDESTQSKQQQTFPLRNQRLNPSKQIVNDQSRQKNNFTEIQHPDENELLCRSYDPIQQSGGFFLGVQDKEKNIKEHQDAIVHLKQIYEEEIKQKMENEKRQKLEEQQKKKEQQLLKMLEEQQMKQLEDEKRIEEEKQKKIELEKKKFQENKNFQEELKKNEEIQRNKIKQMSEKQELSEKQYQQKQQEQELLLKQYKQTEEQLRKKLEQEQENFQRLQDDILRKKKNEEKEAQTKREEEQKQKQNDDRLNKIELKQKQIEEEILKKEQQQKKKEEEEFKKKQEQQRLLEEEQKKKEIELKKLEIEQKNFIDQNQKLLQEKLDKLAEQEKKQQDLAQLLDKQDKENKEIIIKEQQRLYEEAKKKEEQMLQQLNQKEEELKQKKQDEEQKNNRLKKEIELQRQKDYQEISKKEQQLKEKEQKLEQLKKEEEEKLKILEEQKKKELQIYKEKERELNQLKELELIKLKQIEEQKKKDDEEKIRKKKEEENLFEQIEKQKQKELQDLLKQKEIETVKLKQLEQKEKELSKKREEEQKYIQELEKQKEISQQELQKQHQQKANKIDVEQRQEQESNRSNQDPNNLQQSSQLFNKSTTQIEDNKINQGVQLSVLPEAFQRQQMVENILQQEIEFNEIYRQRQGYSYLRFKPSKDKLQSNSYLNQPILHEHYNQNKNQNTLQQPQISHTIPIINTPSKIKQPLSNLSQRNEILIEEQNQINKDIQNNQQKKIFSNKQQIKQNINKTHLDRGSPNDLSYSPTNLSNKKEQQSRQINRRPTISSKRNAVLSLPPVQDKRISSPTEERYEKPFRKQGSNILNKSFDLKKTKCKKQKNNNKIQKNDDYILPSFSSKHQQVQQFDEKNSYRQSHEQINQSINQQIPQIQSSRLNTNQYLQTKPDQPTVFNTRLLMRPPNFLIQMDANEQ